MGSYLLRFAVYHRETQIANNEELLSCSHGVLEPCHRVRIDRLISTENSLLLDVSVVVPLTEPLLDL